MFEFGCLMKKSQQLWDSLPEKTAFFDKKDWYAWLAYGANGQPIEDNDDQVQYLNDDFKKVIRITYEEDGHFDFVYYVSGFDDGKILILNIITNNLTIAATNLNKTIEDWLNGVLVEID